MRYISRIMFCLVTYVLSACGGGGGSSSEPSAVIQVAAPPESNPAIVAIVEPESTVSATQEIQVPEGFTLAANYTVALDVKLEGVYSQRISLSVCTDFSTDGSLVNINYDSCLVKASTNNGNFFSYMEVGNALDSLILAIGVFGESSVVDYRMWERDGSGPYVFSVR